MTKIFTVINQKGGVGKTATAYNSAYALAIKGHKTLLVDMDPSRNATKPYCSIHDYSVVDMLTDKNFDPNKAIYQTLVNERSIENLYIIPSHVSLAIAQYQIAGRSHKEKLLLKQLEKIKDDFEYILIDCPPMLSEFSVNAIFAADFIIIPLRYEGDALEGISDLFKVINEIKEDQYFDYKILRNGLDARKKTVISKIDPELLPFVEKGKVFETIIRQDEEINKAKLEQLPIFVYAPKAIGAIDYVEFTKELINVK